MKLTGQLLFLFISLSLIIAGCDTQDGLNFGPPDLSTVPNEEPFDTTSAERIELDSGLAYYTLEEGSGSFEVVSRDRISVYISVFLTDRTPIINSSYANNRQEPNIFTVSTLETGGAPGSIISQINSRGLYLGVLGMKPGEKRTIIVPPSLAFENASQGSLKFPYRDDTIVYYVELVQILD